MGFKPKTVLSIDVDSDSFVVTELTQRRHKIVLTSQHIVRSADELASLAVNKNQTTVTTLAAPSLFIKQIPSSPALSRAKDLRREILPQLQKMNLPLRLADCFWQALSTGPVVTLVAARKELVEEARSRLSAAGFAVAGVVPSAYGLFNLIAHNYGEKGKFILINMRGRVSDIMIHEDKRLWTYALPMGKNALAESGASADVFLQEIKRVVNTHFLQNPAKSSKTSPRLYLSGAQYPANILASLREQFTGSEIIQVNPLRKISCAKAVMPADPYSIGASVGYGLTSLRAPGTVYVNLIGEQVRTERIAYRINYAEKIGVFSMAAACVALVFLNVRLFGRMNSEGSRARAALAQVKTFVPELNTLKEKKARLDGVLRLLESKIYNQELFLKAMAAVASGSSSGIEIREFELKEGEKGLELYISGTSVDYNEINEFLASLRKQDFINDVKVVSSGAPAGAPAETNKAIEFKIRFDMDPARGIHS